MQKTKEYIKQHRKDDVYRLALAKTPDGVDLQYALQQIAAYQTIEKKIPSWAECDDLIFPPKLSLEQSSSELTARLKASLIEEFMGNKPFSHIDLTGGMGIDCYFVAQKTTHSHYVEQNEKLCQIAQHNFTHLDANIVVHNTTAEEFLNQMTDDRVQSTEHRAQITDYRLETTDNSSLLIPHSSFLIYIDPARRGDHGQKLVSIADCQPNVVELLPQMLEIADKVVVKLSPMLDITRAIDELPHIEKLYVISVGNECKELLLLINKEYNSDTEIYAINIDNKGNKSDILKGSIPSESQINTVHASVIGKYLYEPYAAHLKSGLYKTMAETYGVEKLHQHSHLYTSAELNNEFPGRRFEVEQVVHFDKKSAKSLFKSLKQANLTTRNFPLTVSELRTQFKIKEGGETYIFATTLHDDSKVMIVCRKA
ncbi:MAG: SAM-dependent methyltransferase [Paludibacteraceae bacterium]|nr:SAM-dependent methyltransferase [Paludibacteraceae bacterium]